MHLLGTLNEPSNLFHMCRRYVQKVQEHSGIRACKYVRVNYLVPVAMKCPFSSENLITTDQRHHEETVDFQQLSVSFVEFPFLCAGS